MTWRVSRRTPSSRPSRPSASSGPSPAWRMRSASRPWRPLAASGPAVSAVWVVSAAAVASATSASGSAAAGASAFADASALGARAGPVALAAASSLGSRPSAGVDVVGTSRTLTDPPAASILVRAEAVNASATTKSGAESSPAPRILSGLSRVRTRPTARRMSWLMVIGAASALALPPLGASTSNAPRSASAPIAPTFTTSYSILKRFLKPRSFGMRMWSGVCPPSNQAGIPPPARAFWPLVPRPAVLPLPAAMPRPTRVRAVFDPAGGRRSCNFMPSPGPRTRSLPRR